MFNKLFTFRTLIKIFFKSTRHLTTKQPIGKQLNSVTQAEIKEDLAGYSNSKKCINYPESFDLLISIFSYSKFKWGLDCTNWWFTGDVATSGLARQ